MYFSDFAWQDNAPLIPRAFQVGGYLEQYRERYCKNAKVNLSCRVEKAEQINDQLGGRGFHWRIQTRSGDNATQEHEFDYLIVASGYFGKPSVPEFLREGQFEVPVIHSSKYRNLEQLLGDPTAKKGKILVVGGQLSGVEIAGTIATHLSSALNSPGPGRAAFIDSDTLKPKFGVLHIVQRPTWILPLVTCSAPASSAPPFLPLDINYQNLANRGNGPLQNTQGHISLEAARFVNAKFQAMLATDQSEFSPLLKIKDEDFDQQPFLAISDTYADFVRSGMIGVARGKLASLNSKTAMLGPSREKIEDIAAVVLATGFDAASSVSFFSDELNRKLSTAKGDLNNTVALALHNTLHPDIPNLGFVGFYRSPYWGVMEMQARVVTTIFSAGGLDSPALPHTLIEALKNDTSIERTLALRTDPRASQFPMGDYAWLMQEFGAALGLERKPHLTQMPFISGVEMSILTTARYIGNSINDAQMKEVEKNLGQTQSIVHAGINQGRLVARAIFRSLLGEWKLYRQLIGRRPDQPSGIFTGAASFYLRDGTPHAREKEFAAIEENEGDHGFEYLYVETGDFEDESSGLKFPAKKRQIWRYNEVDDVLSVWSVNSEDENCADKLLHDIEIIPQKEGEETDGWKGKASQRCEKNQSEVQCSFKFQSVNLREWQIVYDVNEQRSNYRTDASYRR
ncbi:hypothetical protein TWF694_000144 [Orbilia ellipsospora]|uniref:L-ornithine N(5)-monooxygenase [NAD(P)H] n=1 Tax=Orbilia ellipsospora TaxID=2528407 RepID=A0AAV9XR50_9PEZI